MQKLIFTGERMLPEVIHTTIIIEHLHRYGLASSFCKDKVVLDIASGEGYGSNLLSQYAKHVTGVDIDKDTIEHAKLKYKSKNLEYKVGSADNIPLADNSVDIVVSFETIEHHDKHEEMMLEIKRVLKPEGIVIISTPDKKYYNADSKHEGNPNEFHVKELYHDEFDSLVKRHFKNVNMLGQQCGTMSTIFPFEKTAITEMWLSKGTTQKLQFSDSLEAIFLIAIASDHPVSYSPISIFNDSKITEAIYKRYTDPIYKSWSYRLGNALLYPVRLFGISSLIKKK